MSKSINIKDLKRGQLVYECERGVNVRMRITKGAHRTDGWDGYMPGWRACARTTNNNSPVRLFQADCTSAYGPHLYDEPAYHGKTIE